MIRELKGTVISFKIPLNLLISSVFSISFGHDHFIYRRISIFTDDIKKRERSGLLFLLIFLKYQ
jgi:hypothetical protein